MPSPAQNAEITFFRSFLIISCTASGFLGLLFAPSSAWNSCWFTGSGCPDTDAPDDGRRFLAGFTGGSYGANGAAPENQMSCARISLPFLRPACTADSQQALRAQAG